MFSFKVSKCWLLIMWCVCASGMCLHQCCEYLHIGPFTILTHGRPTMFLHPLWILHNYPGSSYLWHFTTLIHPWILLSPKLKWAWTIVCAYVVDLAHTDRLTLSLSLTHTQNYYFSNFSLQWITIKGMSTCFSTH